MRKILRLKKPCKIDFNVRILIEIMINLKTIFDLPLKPLSLDSPIAKDLFYFPQYIRKETTQILYSEGNVKVLIINTIELTEKKKGYFKRSIQNILLKGYSVYITTPFPYMKKLLQKFGFIGQYFEPEDNPIEEPLEVMYITPEIIKLPIIYAGITGFDSKVKSVELRAFDFSRRNIAKVNFVFTEKTNSFDFYDRIYSEVQSIYEKSAKLRKEYPNRYRFRFFHLDERGDLLYKWYSEKEE